MTLTKISSMNITVVIMSMIVSIYERSELGLTSGFSKASVMLVITISSKMLLTKYFDFSTFFIACLILFSSLKMKSETLRLFFFLRVVASLI